MKEERAARPRIARRVLVATLATAAMGGAIFAGTALVATRFVWARSESARLQSAAEAIAGAIRREAAEESGGIQAAAVDALAESPYAESRVEVWDGPRLLASNRPAREVSQGTRPGRSAARAGRAVVTGSAMVLVTSWEDAWKRVGGAMLASFGIAAVFAAGVATLVARRLTRETIRPLADLVARVDSLGGFGTRLALPSGKADAPYEVHELEAAFVGLLERLAATLERESRFAADASHELRTPLARLRLLVDRAMESATPEQRPFFAAQQQEIAWLTRLVETLLALAQDPQGGISRGETINLADIVREGVGRLEKQERDRFRVTCPDEALVRGDEALLRAAVENLIDNARKFTPEPRMPSVSIRSFGDRTELILTSPGSHVEPEQRDLLFRRFHRGPLTGSVPGHGLGLALAQHVATLHGGTIVIAPDDVPTFVLTLPVWHPESTGSAAPGSS